MISFEEYVNEIKSKFSDQVEPEVQGVNRNLVFKLDGKLLEFKSENEKNPKDPKYNFFTYEEALACQRDGWRLPTYEEFKALEDVHYYEFDDVNSQGIFNNRLFLPAAGSRNCEGKVGSVSSCSEYWSSTSYDSKKAWAFFIGSTFGVNSGAVLTHVQNQCWGLSVRLVREV